MSILKQRRVYDREFKQEKIRLVIEKTLKAADAARNLGIGKSTVSRWIREMREDPSRQGPP